MLIYYIIECRSFVFLIKKGEENMKEYYKLKLRIMDEIEDMYTGEIKEDCFYSNEGYIVIDSTGFFEGILTEGYISGITGEKFIYFVLLETLYEPYINNGIYGVYTYYNQDGYYLKAMTSFPGIYYLNSLYHNEEFVEFNVLDEKIKDETLQRKIDKKLILLKKEYIFY